MARKRVAPLFRPINANAELDHAGQAATPLLNLILGVGKHIQTQWNAIVPLAKYANPYAPDNSAAWTGFASQLHPPVPLQMVHARERAAPTSALRLAVSPNAAIPIGSTVGILGLPRAVTEATRRDATGRVISSRRVPLNTRGLRAGILILPSSSSSCVRPRHSSRHPCQTSRLIIPGF